MTQPLDLFDAAVREMGKDLRVDRLLPWPLDCACDNGDLRSRR